MHLEPLQWVFGILAAILVGFTKTGVPGLGILVVPLLAGVFGGRPAIGIMLPMLIFADCFAVFWYRRHAQWKELVKLFPWVGAGILLGGVGLWWLGRIKTEKDILNPVIGVIVLLMLALHVIQTVGKVGISPRSRVAVASTGAVAGFVSTVSNAAGSIMSIYLTAMEMPKEKFMGTIAWYFFLGNLAKVPVYLAVPLLDRHAAPIMTLHSMGFVLMTAPAIIVGLILGKVLLPRISQKAFEGAVLVLAALSAINLIVR